MDAVSFISAVVAVCGAGLTGFFGYWQQQRLRRDEQRDYMGRYGASLAWAAYDLQSRVYNILRGHAIDQAPGPGYGFLTACLTHGTAREAEYVRRNTVFVLAEYLGWVEILRGDVQFLDLGKSRTNRRVITQLSSIQQSLNRIDPVSNELRVYRGHQRAIGEVMIDPAGEPGRRRCLGYAEFCARLDGDPGFAHWFEPLLDDVDRLGADTAPAVARLTGLQQQLIALIDLLDPHGERFPQFRRSFGT